MRYTVYVNILPQPELLDPAGKATLHGLHTLGYERVQDVRVGKRIQLQVEADSPEQARQVAAQASEQLLANVIVESWEVEAA